MSLLQGRTMTGGGIRAPRRLQRVVAVPHAHHVRTRQPAVSASMLKGILCDLDGVMYTSGDATAIPGAADTFHYFQERQVPWLFVTNTVTMSREGLAERLRGMGIPCTADHIVTPAKLAADWLRSNNIGPVSLFVDPELDPEFEGVVRLPPDAESGAAAVVIGDMGLSWNYAALNRAFRLVMEGTLRNEASGQPVPRPRCRESAAGPPALASTEQCPASNSTPGTPLQSSDQDQDPLGCPWSSMSMASLDTMAWPPDSAVRPATGALTMISLGKGRYYKDTDGYSLDVGPFTAAIEYATDQKAVVLGKPDPLIFCLAARSLGLEPHEVMMIGDDVRGDVGGAQAAGLQGLLARTGKFRERDLHVGVTPDAVLSSIADLPAWWEVNHHTGAVEERGAEEAEMQPWPQPQPQEERQARPAAAGAAAAAVAGSPARGGYGRLPMASRG